MSALNDTSVRASWMPFSMRGLAPTSKRRGWLVRRALLVADILGLVVAFSVAEVTLGSEGFRGNALSRPTEAGFFVLTLPIWVVLAKVYGLYDRDEERTDHSTVDDLPGVFHLVTVGTWAVYVGVRLTHLLGPNLPRIVIFWALAIVAVTGARSIARIACRRHASYVQNTIIVGADRVGRLLARKLRRHPEYGLRVVGFVDSGPAASRPARRGVPVLGPLDRLPDIVSEFRAGRVIMGFPSDGDEQLLRHIRHLNERDVQVDVVPRLFEVIGPGVDVYTAEGLALLGLRPFRLSRSSLLIKRIVDVVVSSAALVLLAPLFALIALVIKLDSPGPAFFRHERMRGGDRRFLMWKFRTMVPDAETRKEEVAHLNSHAAPGGDPRMFKIPDDPRVTRTGRFLRRLSLDELPQLLNVLRGEMSLVGPRPLIPEEHEHVTNWRRHRLDLKPGMTGLWQVSGRSAIPFEEMVTLDYRYVASWSLGRDVRLILKTVPQVLRGASGAL